MKLLFCLPSFLITMLLAYGNVHAFDGEFWVNTGFEKHQREFQTVYNLLALPSGRVLAGTSNGAFASDDHGTTFYPLKGIDPFIAPGLLLLQDGTVLVGGRDTLYRSDDGGDTWSAQTGGGIARIDFHRMVQNARGDIFAITNGNTGQFVPRNLWSSKDNGHSWSLACEQGSYSISLAVHPNGDVFWGSWDRFGVFALRAETQTCHNVITPFGGNEWEPLSMAVNSKGHVMIGTDQLAKLILTSENAGKDWIEYDHWRNPDKPYGKPRAMVVDKFDNFFISARDTVWYTDNFAQTWKKLPGHLGHHEIIYSISVDSSSYLFVGTDQGRIYRSREPIYTATSLNNPDVENLTTETLNLTLSPNPTSGELTINFLLANEELVAMRLYDLRGLLVKQLPEQRMTAGAQTLSLDVVDLGPGVYSLRLEAGGIVVNRLVVVTR